MTLSRYAPEQDKLMSRRVLRHVMGLSVRLLSSLSTKVWIWTSWSSDTSPKAAMHGT